MGGRVVRVWLIGGVMLWLSGMTTNTFGSVGCRRDGQPESMTVSIAVSPRVEVLPYEPREEKQRAFVVNLFRYVWLVGIAMIVVPVILLAWRKWQRFHRARSPNLCAGCGYDLRHVAERGCPECGEGRAG